MTITFWLAGNLDLLRHSEKLCNGKVTCFTPGAIELTEKPRTRFFHLSRNSTRGQREVTLAWYSLPLLRQPRSKTLTFFTVCSVPRWKLLTDKEMNEDGHHRELWQQRGFCSPPNISQVVGFKKSALWTVTPNLWWETPEAVIGPQETPFTLSNNEIILNTSVTVHFHLNVKHLSVSKNPKIPICS